MRNDPLLLVSNVFMTRLVRAAFEIRTFRCGKVVLVSWGIAFSEYCFMVPANRYGYTEGFESAFS